MIPITRQGCVRSLVALSLSVPAFFYPPFPHAESSRQARLRSILANHQAIRSYAATMKGKAVDRRRSYAKAALAEREHSEEEDVAEVGKEHGPSAVSERVGMAAQTDVERGNRSTRPPTHPTPAKAAPRYPTDAAVRQSYRPLPSPQHRSQHPLASLSTFPLGRDRYLTAFLSLASASQLTLDNLSTSDLRTLSAEIDKLWSISPELILDADRDITRASLARLASLLSAPSSSAEPSERSATWSLQDHFRLCLIFGHPRLAAAALQSQFRSLTMLSTKGEIEAERQDAGNVDYYALLLTDFRHWRILLDLFAPSSRQADAQLPVPPSFYTPILLETLMLATLASAQPYLAPRIFALHAQLVLNPTPASFAHLIQAHLELGELRLAKRALDVAQDVSKIDEEPIQRALLVAHQKLGFDADLESRLLAGLEAIRSVPQARLLNDLISANLIATRYARAESLLGRFDHDWYGTGSPGGKIRPTDSTLYCAFRVFAALEKEEPMLRAWNALAALPLRFSDRRVAGLVEELFHAGMIDRAYDIVAERLGAYHLMATPRNELRFRLKPHMQIGVKTFNRLIAGHSKSSKYDGLKRVLRLMRHAKIAPDDNTIRQVILTVGSDPTFAPEHLVKLLQALLERMDTPPTMAQIDSVIANAIKAAVPDSSRFFTHPSTDSESLMSDVLAGLRPAGAFALALEERLLPALREAGARPTSRGLANRLRYDAMTRVTGPRGIPSVRVVWNALLERGYRPNRRHILNLMQGYCDAGEMGECEGVLALAQSAGIKASRGTHMVLLRGYASVGQLGKAMHAYRQIKSLGGPGREREGLDIAAVTAMIQACYQHGRFRLAVSLLERDLLGELVERRAMRLDEQAVSVGASAWAWAGQPDRAIDILALYPGGDLTRRLRRVARKLRIGLIRRIARADAMPAEAPEQAEKDMDALGRVEKMLAEDDLKRPAWLRWQAGMDRKVRGESGRQRVVDLVMGDEIDAEEEVSGGLIGLMKDDGSARGPHREHGIDEDGLGKSPSGRLGHVRSERWDDGGGWTADAPDEEVLREMEEKLHDRPPMAALVEEDERRMEGIRAGA